MKRIAVFPALWLAACGSPAAPSDMSGGNGDQAMAPAADQSVLADLATSLMDLAMPVRDMAVIPDFSTLPDLSSKVDMANGYPPAPYGANVGDTIAPLVWEGYNNPTAIGLANVRPYGQLTMNDLRTSGNKFALVYTADTV